MIYHQFWCFLTHTHTYTVQPIDGKFISSIFFSFPFLTFYRSIIILWIHRATKAKNFSRSIYKVARFSPKSFSIVKSKALMHWKLKHVMEHRRHDQTAMDNPIQVRNTNTRASICALFYFFRFIHFLQTLKIPFRRLQKNRTLAARIEPVATLKSVLISN